jgi:TATA-binding protein-associated factor Taf7
MTEAELKARLMAAVEAEVDRLVKWEMGAKGVTFTQIEDEVLARREEIGRQMAENVLAHREGMRGGAIPENAESGKRLNPKGKKKDP